MGENQNSTGDDGGIKAYITRHMLIGVVLAVVVIIVLKIVLGLFEPSDQSLTDTSGVTGHDRVEVNAALPQASHMLPGDTLHRKIMKQLCRKVPAPCWHRTPGRPNRKCRITRAMLSTPLVWLGKMNVHRVPENPRFAKAPQTTNSMHPVEQKTTPAHTPAPGSAAGHATETHGAGQPETPSFPVVGMVFVDASDPTP